jgi:hypothetical protein
MRILISIFIVSCAACNGKEILYEGPLAKSHGPLTSIKIPGAAASQPPPLPPKMDCNKTIFVTELYIDPKRVKDRMGEFIEIFNGDKVPVTLNGWRLTDLAGDSHIIGTEQPFTLKPGAFGVLGVNANAENNGGIRVDYQYQRFNLSNDADRVRLEDPCGNPVFDVSYPLPRNWPKHRSGYSIELTVDPRSNKRPKWRRSRHRLKSGDYATPGFAPWAKRAKAPRDARVLPLAGRSTARAQKTRRKGGSDRE